MDKNRAVYNKQQINNTVNITNATGTLYDEVVTVTKNCKSKTDSA